MLSSIPRQTSGYAAKYNGFYPQVISLRCHSVLDVHDGDLYEYVVEQGDHFNFRPDALSVKLY